MRIRHVTITVPDPDETAAFLSNALGFAAESDDDNQTLKIGSSSLTLVEGATEPDGYYHLAFDIPENAVAEARDLLAARIPIFTAGDKGITTGAPVWDSHSVYFNAPGNLNLELIGRHRLPNAIGRAFSFSDVLHISEVGVPVDEPLETIREIEARTGLTPFGEPSASFAPMGSDDGLLIIVKHGRTWYPATDQTTTRRPLQIRVEGFDGELLLGPSSTVTGM